MPAVRNPSSIIRLSISILIYGCFLMLRHPSDHCTQFCAWCFPPTESSINTVDHPFGFAHPALLFVVSEFPDEADADAPSLFYRSFDFLLRPASEAFARHLTTVEDALDGQSLRDIVPGKASESKRNIRGFRSGTRYLFEVEAFASEP